MEKLKCIQKKLIDCLWEQLKDMEHADTRELGQVVDMIKDISEAYYYYTVTEAMLEKAEWEGQPEKIPEGVFTLDDGMNGRMPPVHEPKK